MNTKKTLRWYVEPSTTPLYQRNCNRCKKTTLYYCSEKFRINAQRKNLDVWLIYKCQKCDNTSNITILSRIKPQAINKEEYDNFLKNDVDTAWKYAFNFETINRNKIAADFSNIEYRITGDILTLDEIQEQEESLIEFEIGVKYNLDLKISYVIRQGLAISLSQMEDMLSAGVITIFPIGPVKKRKLQDGDKVTINRDKLKIYVEKKEVVETEGEAGE